MFLILLLSLFPHAAFSKETISSDCPPGKHYIRAHFRRGYLRSDGRTVIPPSNIKAHCRTNPEGYIFWQPKLSNKNPPDWPHKKEVFKNWTSEEIERVIDALSEIPSSLWSKNIKNIFRSFKSKDFPNPASSSDGTIILYDTAFSEAHNLTRILAHELAHQKYLDLSENDRQSYWYPMNWLPIDRKKGLFVSRKDGFIQDDGRESPEEDFANNVDSFLFEPDNLKRTTPYAYDWIKKYFGDKFILRRGK